MSAAPKPSHDEPAALVVAQIDQRIDHYLRFATNPAVPFDNNASEREIRMCKLRIEVSGCMCSMRGARELYLIRSCLQTASKHARNRTYPVTPEECRLREPLLQCRRPQAVPP